MDILQVLENAISSPDPIVRSEAEGKLHEVATNHFVEYISLLADALANEDAKTEVKMLAGLGLKNAFTAKDVNTRRNLHQKWLNLEEGAKLRIKETAIKALVASDQSSARSAAQLVAAIADIELPLNQWPELIPLIIENTKPENEVHVKKASLLAIGYICETLNPNDPHVLAQANGILIAIVQGAQSLEQNTEVRLTALNALVNSLEFIKYNFDKEGERNYIMQVVCEATQADSSELQEAAFGCLAKIMSLYYRYMSVYMEKALFGLTVSGMRSPDERVACMAVEFWSCVCEEELDYSIESNNYGPEAASQLVSYNFALIAINEVYPTLLTLLTRQNEDPEDDDWSVAMAAGACIQLFAQNTGNYIIQSTWEFVSANINSQNWREREAAVMAFGSILDGPEIAQLKGNIVQALPVITQLMTDESLHVRETVAWCLGRIADLAISAISIEDHLPGILQVLMLGLQDHHRVATSCCWTFMNLAEQLCTEGPEAETTVLSPFLQPIIPLFMQLANNHDTESLARDAAFEALSSFVSTSGQDGVPIIQQIAQEVLTKLEQTIGQQQQPLASDTRVNLEDLQISMLALLTTIIRRLSDGVSQGADNLMEMFLKLLESIEPNALIEEDIFIAISAVASATGNKFLNYMDNFLPFLTRALSNVDSPTATTAVGLVADLTFSLGESIVPYLDGFMTLLGSALNNENGRRELRPAIISCFGNMATTLGGHFQQYTPFVVNICRMASTYVPPDNSEETIEYIFSLKEAILECYSGIVGNLQEQPEVLLELTGEIFLFLQEISSDIDMSSVESIASSIVGILGDIGAMFEPARFNQAYQQPWVTDIIKRTRANDSFSETTRNTARWAREQQKRQIGLS